MMLSLVKEQIEILAEFEEGQMLRSERYIWRKQEYVRVCSCIQPLTDLLLALSLFGCVWDAAEQTDELECLMRHSLWGAGLNTCVWLKH